MKPLALLALTLMLAACGSPELRPGRTPRLPLNDCPTPRPQACTSDYNPVCADAGDGPETFPNGCSACADRGVKAFYLGACPEPDAGDAQDTERAGD